jgi:hypothetical protein
MPVLSVEDDGYGQHAHGQHHQAAAENRDEHPERDAVGRHRQTGSLRYPRQPDASGCMPPLAFNSQALVCRSQVGGRMAV